MNRIIKLISALVLYLMPTLAHAEWYNNITFVVGSEESVPITVRYDGKTYKVYSSTTINTTGNTYTPSATDANGKSMKYKFDSKTESRGSNKYHTYVYTFYSKTQYNSTNQSSPSSSQGTYQNWGSNPAWGELGQELSRRNSQRAAEIDGDAYPGLYLYTGISKAYGEFARLRVALGGFNGYAGIGKDWLFNGINKNKLLWHAGIGGLYHFGDKKNPWGDISGMVTVAQTAAWEKISLMIDCDFTYWFGRWCRVGCFGGAGFGFANINDVGKKNAAGTKFAWNLEFGLTFRLAHF